ncbi:MAG: hypothetical protein H0T46_06070 [Deltaproteobacteria bacterium]|nr:hypothetical protein [Deltaproteobacteria bacterium]
MNKGNALLIGAALGFGFYVWHHGGRVPKAAPPAATPPSLGLASLHELSHLRAVLARNAKRGDLVPVAAHHRSWPGTSLRHR